MQLQPMGLGQNQLQGTSLRLAVNNVKSMNLMTDKVSIVTPSLSHNGGHFTIRCIKLTLMHLCKPLRLNCQAH